MYKLWATILKDVRILARDKIGLIFMFIMPILLVVVITSVQNSTFEVVNDNKIPLLLCNKDTGAAGRQLVTAIEKIGMFRITVLAPSESEKNIGGRMHAKDALIAITIPEKFSSSITLKADNIASRALNDFGVTEQDTAANAGTIYPLTLYYHPVLQQSFRQSIGGALNSALQSVQSRQILKSLYFSLNEKEIPDSLERDIVTNQVGIKEIAVSRNGSRSVPNASQHNIPSWTIFAMFFVVISLGSSVVREKLNGSFVRLKTLPTNYFIALLSKQITYLCVTMIQTAVIFSIGVWVFPLIGLPRLNIPSDIAGLLIVSLICGWCAVSYALCIGVFAQTPEQANGFGAFSIVILSAIGGLLVPSFAMPASFQGIMKLSPLHWCLEAYYGLFLENGSLKDILVSIYPLLGIILFLALLTFAGLKRKKLI